MSIGLSFLNASTVCFKARIYMQSANTWQDRRQSVQCAGEPSRVDERKDENKEEVESIGRRCGVDAGLNNMNDFQDGLVKQVEQLKNNLNTERDSRKAVEKS